MRDSAPAGVDYELIVSEEETTTHQSLPTQMDRNSGRSLRHGYGPCSYNHRVHRRPCLVRLSRVAFCVCLAIHGAEVTDQTHRRMWDTYKGVDHHSTSCNCVHVVGFCVELFVDSHGDHGHLASPCESVLCLLTHPYS